MSKRLLTLVTTVVMLMSVFGAAHAQSTVVNPSPTISTVGAVPANGFIMSDGRICNPHRMGC